MQLSNCPIVQVEYQRPNQRKHTAKLYSKFQNLSAGNLDKYNSFVELQMTQFPKKNFHLSWNVQRKPQEHLENEITLMWSDQMRDPRHKIHVLQISRATGLTGGRTATTENVLNVEIAPLNINWQVKAGGHVEKGETPKFKVEFEAADKQRPTQATKANFEYQHISRKPLKLSMDALFRIPSREVIYSDKLEEVAPNEYKGKTQFQWEENKKATLDYTYRVKTDSRKTHHELDAELKTPSMKYGTHHQALLRMTPSDIEIKSKLNHERNQLWDFSSLLSQQGKSNVYLDTAAFTSKFDTNPYEKAKSASFELTGKTFPLSHQSNFQSEPNKMTVSSKTIYKANPLLTLQANRSPRGADLMLQTPMFDARFDGNQASTPKTATIDIKTKTTPGSHRTTIAADQNKVEIKSKTNYKNKPIANVDALLTMRGPQAYAGKWNVQSDRFVHEADVQYEPRKLIVATDNKRGQKSVFRMDANLIKDGQSKIAIVTDDSNAVAEIESRSARVVVNTPRYVHKVREKRCFYV